MGEILHIVRLCATVLYGTTKSRRSFTSTFCTDTAARSCELAPIIVSLLHHQFTDAVSIGKKLDIARKNFKPVPCLG